MMDSIANPECKHCGEALPDKERGRTRTLMARGACGDFFIENPIDHLNGLQALLLDCDDETLSAERERSHNHGQTIEPAKWNEGNGDDE
jgi:hypothetical protein